MRRILLALTCLAATTLCGAQDPDSERLFEAAWEEFRVASEAGDSERVIDSLRVVLDVAQQVLPPDDERLPLVWMSFGNALANSGRWEAAREYQDHAFELAAEIHGDDSPRLVPYLTSYADTQARYQRSDKQEKYYRRALRIVEREYGEDSIEYARVAYRGGSRVLDLSRTTGGRRFLQDAYEIFARELGADSNEAALAAYYLGRIERLRRKDDEAIEYFLLALDGLAENTQQQNSVRAQLVMLLDQEGRPDEATEQLIAIAATTNPDEYGEYRPMYRAPVSDPRPWEERTSIETVDLEFTVDENGHVRDPVVMASAGGEQFALSAIESVLKWRYVPKMAGGVPVATENVPAQITFYPAEWNESQQDSNSDDLPPIESPQ